MYGASYEWQMQCINVRCNIWNGRCNVPMLYPMYQCHMQCTNVGRNPAMLYAIYECYMEGINVICNVPMLYAMYQC